MSSSIQPATLKFIADLTKNNNKPWFDANRGRYDTAKQDFENFISQLLSKLVKTDPEMEGLTARKCIFRINRDIRFSKDKSPYKTNFGASMDRGGRNSGFAGYYIHLEPGNKSMIGGGLWMPEGAQVKKVRQEIDYNWDEFKSLIDSKKFKSTFKDLYKGADMSLSRVPQGYDIENPAAAYLKLKSWFVTRELTDEEVTSASFLETSIDGFKTCMPLIRFLNRAIEE